VNVGEAEKWEKKKFFSLIELCIDLEGGVEGQMPPQHNTWQPPPTRRATFLVSIKTPNTLPFPLS
jgi:hypothetical protein